MSINTEEEERLMEILNTIRDCDLRGWNKEFISDIRSQYEEIGSEIFISGKMWKNLNRIYEQAIS
jgi:hypothetical protein